jgi:uncharacterized membrane protein YedE/YeeE
MEDFPVLYIVTSLGFVLGMLFGGTAQKTHFCTMGAISDIYFIGDWNRFRAWMLAMAVAMVGSQSLHLAGVLDLNDAIYLSSTLGWAGAIFGGLMFGFGMTLGGGCGNKTLVRLGAGNLKSLVVAIVIGVFAYMTLRGLVGLARVELEAATSIDLTVRNMTAQGVPDFLTLIGLEAEMARWISVLVVAGGTLWFCLKSASFRASKPDLFSGLIIGVLVTAAWYVTGVIGFDDFDPTPMASFSFVAPVGESIQYLMTYTGATINFGIAVVGGIIAGSFVVAKVSGDFHLESFADADDMVRHISGGALMGIGGVMALGCTVGQGVTGMSTLAVGSVLALISIIGGGIFGMKYLEEGTLGEAVKALFVRG